MDELGGNKIKSKNKKKGVQVESKKRVKIFYLLLTLFASILAFRLTFLHLFTESKKNLQNIANKQYLSTLKQASYRGTIYDHRKTPLAISIKTPSLAINPRAFLASRKQKRQLCKLLKVSPSKLNSLIRKKSYFSWLKRKTPHELARKVKKLRIKGLYYIWEPARYYPFAHHAAQVLGYVGTDNSGLLGLEQKFEKTLKGDFAKIQQRKDARGSRIYLNPRLANPQKPSSNITLTLDHVIQDIVETSLHKGVKASGAKKGFAIVADPHTGRILALANYPGFNPNRPLKNMESTNNLAITNRFEPGSILKPFVIASALEKNKIGLYDLHHCTKEGRLEVSPGTYIHDDHPREFASTEEIIIHSSNICTFKVAQKLSAEGLYDSYRQFGFAGTKPILDFPGETTGSLAHWKKWSPLRFSNISFGQGLSTTGLEVVRAYSVIANGGTLINPYLIEKISSPEEKTPALSPKKSAKRILSAKIAEQIRNILYKVVEEGTGSAAKVNSFTTAGKTGTAQKIDPKSKKYAPHLRIASFAGFAPAYDPHIVIYVALDEPSKKPYYGGKWAAPVFSQIAEKTLEFLNVSPDKS